jgi:hypothetical protein
MHSWRQKEKQAGVSRKIIATEHEYVFQGLIKVIENGISRLPELEFHEH